MNNAVTKHFCKRDICERLRISERTLDRLITQGKFPPADVAPNRRIRRWRVQTVEQWEQQPKG